MAPGTTWKRKKNFFFYLVQTMNELITTKFCVTIFRVVALWCLAVIQHKFWTQPMPFFFLAIKFYCLFQLLLGERMKGSLIFWSFKVDATIVNDLGVAKEWNAKLRKQLGKFKRQNPPSAFILLIFDGMIVSLNFVKML